ncbi:transcriptional regulator-like protein [Pseudomonas putida]|nr:WYL domain-containing protein [Pseudomonas putida]MDZ7329363.1 WYL domain-containing protein [Pseudomonas sp. SDS3-8]EKT4461915.1 WYL domain-containing protein [Pseudomonas putida]EKT4554100.1 WYL domain-containing protein [Pseudomonas putida]MCC9008025.1 WYL domain-containing protein [Pseudomonas putida]MDO1465786.1 WYL domain-containing protein [Pseudomonas putida]
MINLAHRRDYLRQILRAAGKPLSTADVHAKLVAWVGRHGDAADDQRDKTTIRDLKALEELNYVQSQTDPEDKRGLLWSAVGRSHSLVLSPSDAMSLWAVFQHAERFGLQSATDELKGLRDYTELVMQDGSVRKLNFTKRITSGTRFTQLQPGKYKAQHLKQIQMAILDNEALEVWYRPRNADGVECVYQLKPLGLSHQDSNIYLSAYVTEEQWLGNAPAPDEPRGKYSSNGPNTLCALMLHRITKVEPGKRIIDDPEGYDIHADEAQTDLVTIHSPAQKTRLRLSQNLYNRLAENPLDKNQKLLPDGDKWLLTCKVRDTQGLRLFLMANAADIEVLEPLALRAHIHEMLTLALKTYEQ